MDIQSAVDRGLEIRQQLDLLKKELSLIEDQLSLAARQGEQIDLEDDKRDGKQYLAKGSEYIVPVVLTADVIQSSFIDGSDIHERISQIAGNDISSFYKPVTTWKTIPKTGKAFRELAFEVLGNTAPSFIVAATAVDKNGIPKSQIKIDWERITKIEED